MGRKIMKTLRVYGAVLAVFFMTFAFVLPVFADDVGSVTKEDVKGLAKAPGYAPYGGRSFPTKVLWGDDIGQSHQTKEPQYLV